MEKTFCDRCNKEIPRKRGTLVKHELELERVEEDGEGNVQRTTTRMVELCSPCRALVGLALESALKR